MSYEITVDEILMRGKINEQPPRPTVDDETAAIAAFDPSRLTSAINDVFNRSEVAAHNQDRRQIGEAFGYLEEVLHKGTKTWDEIPEDYTSRVWSILEVTLAEQRKNESEYSRLGPSRDFAWDISKKRRELSRPYRLVAAGLCALAIGGFAGKLTHDQIQDSAKVKSEVSQVYEDYVVSENTNPQASSQEDTSYDLTDYARIGVFGGLTGLLGGLAGLTGLGLSGTVAHLRAKQIVNSTAQETALEKDI